MSAIATGLYSFKNFKDLTESESGEVLRGRNDPQVRRWMTSDQPIDADDHRRFMSGLKCNDKSLYVRIERAGCFVGVYSLNDLADDSALGGFWVTAYARDRLLPLNVVFQGMDYMFSVQGIGRIYGHQKKSNQSAIRLNALLGLYPSKTLIAHGEDTQQIEINRQRWTQMTARDPRLLKLMDRMEKLNGTT